MKKTKVLITFVILASFFLIINFYSIKLNTYKNNSVNAKEILNYDLGTSFEKNGKIISRSDLVTTKDGLFDYDINFNITGKSKKFKLIILINYIPENFSLDNGTFSTEKDITISSSKQNIIHNFKLKNIIKGFSVCNFILIPDDIQQDPSNVNCIPYLSGVINNTKENKSLFKNENIDILNNEKLSKTQDFNLLINSKLSKGKLLKYTNIIKRKPGEKLIIPILGNLHNKFNCNYTMFLNNQLIEFNGTFSKSIKIIGGNIFSDNISINVPNKKGKYIIWGFIQYNLYEQEPVSAISSDDFIILQVE